jgi:hypothetical protein
MAGPAGRQARRLSAFEGDERLMARVGPEMGALCSYVAGKAREVLELAEAGPARWCLCCWTSSTSTR